MSRLIFNLSVLILISSNLGCQKEKIEDVDIIISNLKIHLSKLEAIFASKNFFIPKDQNEFIHLDLGIRNALNIEEISIKNELNKISNKSEFIKKINTIDLSGINKENSLALMATPCYDAYQNQTTIVRNTYLTCMFAAEISANPVGMGICTIAMAVGSLGIKAIFDGCMTRTYGPQD